MAIIELKNISGLLEATMSDYLDSAVVKEKTTRKELVKLLQATDESLGTALNIMEEKNASRKALEHQLELQKLEIKTLQGSITSLEHDLGEAVLEKNSAEERETEVKHERDNYKSQLESAFNELQILKNSYNLVLDQLNTVRGENTELRESLEGYKSRGFFARIFGK